MRSFQNDKLALALVVFFCFSNLLNKSQKIGQSADLGQMRDSFVFETGPPVLQINPDHRKLMIRNVRQCRFLAV